MVQARGLRGVRLHQRAARDGLRASRGQGIDRSSRAHPLGRAAARRGSRTPGRVVVRTLLAYPHEGLDRRRGGGRPRGGPEGPSDGSCTNQRTSLAPRGPGGGSPPQVAGVLKHRRLSIRRSLGICGVGSCDHDGVPPLSAKQRAQLPASAFAYIDSRGRRRLPIHDASHVRNALARFSQVAFEDEDARNRARSRLLRAAKKHGIMPIGFISAQLQPQRKLPKGQVTFLLTDIEGSTELLRRLDDQYAPLLADIRRRVRDAVRRAAGHDVSARGDDVFAVFERAPSALEAALTIQRTMRVAEGSGGVDVRLRIGLHRGRPALTDTGYVGLSVHAAASICFAVHGGQIVLSSAVRAAVIESLPEGVSLTRLGAWRFRGLPEPVELFQVHAADLLTDFPPPRAATPAE